MYVAHEPVIARLLRGPRHGFSEQDAHDITAAAFTDVLQRAMNGTLSIESNLAGFLWTCAVRKSIDFRRREGRRPTGTELRLDAADSRSADAEPDDASPAMSDPTIDDSGASASDTQDKPSNRSRGRPGRMTVSIDTVPIEDPHAVDPELQSVLECLRDVVLRYYEEDPARAAGLIHFALWTGDNPEGASGKEAERGAVRQAFAHVAAQYPDRFGKSNADNFRKFDMYKARERLRQLSLENCQFDIKREWGRNSRHGRASLG